MAVPRGTPSTDATLNPAKMIAMTFGRAPGAAMSVTKVIDTVQAAPETLAVRTRATMSTS